jgi:hypothetical protein
MKNVTLEAIKLELLSCRSLSELVDITNCFVLFCFVFE